MSGHLARGSWVWVGAAALAAAAWWLAGVQVVSADPPRPVVGNSVPNGLCLICHGGPGLTVDTNGRERAIAPVDVTAFNASAHGGKTCVACHADQAALPHLPLSPVGSAKTAAGCQSCHQEAYDGYRESPHGTMAKLQDTNGPTCASCHGNVHTVRPVAQWTEQERKEICAGCHPGAGTGFLKALSHKAPSASFLPTAYFAGRFLVVLAASALAFGIIHVELDLLRWLVRRWRTNSAKGERWEAT